MLNVGGIKKVTATNVNSILFDFHDCVAVGVVVDKTNADAETVDGRKILRAGTPLTGDLTARTTKFKKPTDAETSSNAVGILLHDVDVTDADANATLVLWGFVNMDRLSSKASGLITSNIKEALKNAIWFLK